jgi:hypothetical protein
MTVVRASPSGSGRPLRYGAVLRSPPLRRIAAAHAISMFGTVAADSALSLLIYTETRSALYAALAFSVVFVPQAVSGALLGGLSGRYGTRKILVGANLASAVFAAAMAAPPTPVGWQLVLAALLGAVVPVHDGTRAAALMTALDHDTFLAVRSALRITAQLAVVSGFVCGGTLTVLAGARVVLLGNAVSFGCAALLLSGAGAVVRGGGAGRGTAASLAAVVQVIRRRALRRTALRLWLPVSFASAGSALAVAYAAGTGQGGTAAGLLLAAFAGGTVAGEICVSRLPAAVRRRSASSLILLTQLPAVGFAASPPLGVALVLRALSGGGFAYLQCLDTDLARGVEAGIRRQVLVVLSSGAMACQGLAMAAAGALAQVARPALVIAGSGAAGAVACLAVPGPRLES